MKERLFAILLACILPITLLASCTRGSSSLAECGEDVISMMTEMLTSDEYISLYTISSISYDEQINALRKGDYSKSLAIYELSIPEKELLDKTVDKDKMSDELYEYICSSAYTSFASRVNEPCGIEAMTVSAIITAQKTYAYEDIDTKTIYLYVFEKGCPIAVTFVSGGNNSLKAVGHFIVNDNFITDDESSIKESLKTVGINDVTVTKQ